MEEVQLISQKCVSLTERLPFIPPLSEEKKHVIMEALHNHYVMRGASTAASDDYDVLEGAAAGYANWVADPVGDPHWAAADADNLLAIVACFASMSNDRAHPRVTACASFNEYEIMVKGAMLVASLWRAAPANACSIYMGLMAPTIAGGAHCVYRLKLGVFEVFFNDNVHRWDFRFAWEKHWGTVQTTIDGELIDSGFIQRVAAVVDWHEPAKRTRKRCLDDQPLIFSTNKLIRTR